MKHFIFLLGSIFFFFQTGKTQEEVATERRFSGGFTAGFNAAQIDGDGMAGYNKLGAYGGVVAAANFGEHTYLSTGITFSQRGAAPGLTGNAQIINFNMIEVPAIFHYKDKKTEMGFYRIHVGAGLCYSRLISARTNVTIWNDNKQYFGNNNLNWLMEFMVYKNEHFSLGLRYNRAINRIYKRPFFGAPNTSFLEHWLSFKSMYYF